MTAIDPPNTYLLVYLDENGQIIDLQKHSSVAMRMMKYAANPIVLWVPHKDFL
jgi:hypothetical protein